MKGGDLKESILILSSKGSFGNMTSNLAIPDYRDVSYACPSGYKVNNLLTSLNCTFVPHDSRILFYPAALSFCLLAQFHRIDRMKLLFSRKMLIPLQLTSSCFKKSPSLHAYGNL